MKNAVSSPEAQDRSSFKAERVQLAPGKAGKPKPSRFKSERVQLGLARLDSWKAIETRRVLIGNFELASDGRAGALAGALASLFGERRKGSVSVVQNRLTVRVESPLEQEIAQAELQFARRVSRLIEEFQKGWESR